MKKILYGLLPIFLLVSACKKDKDEHLTLRNEAVNDQTPPKIITHIISHPLIDNYTPYDGVQKIIMTLPNTTIRINLEVGDDVGLSEYEVWIEEYNVKGAALSNWTFRDRQKVKAQSALLSFELTVPEGTMPTLYSLNFRLRDLGGNETLARPIIIRVEEGEHYDTEKPSLRMQTYLQDSILQKTNGFVDMSVFVSDNKKLMSGKIIVECFEGLGRTLPISSKVCDIPLSQKYNTEALLHVSTPQLPVGKYSLRLTMVDNVGNYIRSDFYKVNVR